MISRVAVTEARWIGRPCGSQLRASHVLGKVSRMRVVVALLGLLLLTVPAHGAPRTNTKAMTIRVVSVTVGAKMIVDKAPKGVRSVGDIHRAKFLLRNERPQFDKPKGALVGSEVAIYTFESLAIGTVKVTTKFPGGTIRSSDRRSFEGCCATKSQVTGGIGVFAGARGTVSSEQLAVRPGDDPFLELERHTVDRLGERDLKVYRLELP